MRSQRCDHLGADVRPNWNELRALTAKSATVRAVSSVLGGLLPHP